MAQGTPINEAAKNRFYDSDVLSQTTKDKIIAGYLKVEKLYKAYPVGDNKKYSDIVFYTFVMGKPAMHGIAACNILTSGVDSFLSYDALVNAKANFDLKLTIKQRESPGMVLLSSSTNKTSYGAELLFVNLLDMPLLPYVSEWVIYQLNPSEYMILTKEFKYGVLQKVTVPITGCNESAALDCLERACNEYDALPNMKSKRYYFTDGQAGIMHRFYTVNEAAANDMQQITPRAILASTPWLKIKPRLRKGTKRVL